MSKPKPTDKTKDAYPSVYEWDSEKVRRQIDAGGPQQAAKHERALERLQRQANRGFKK